MICICTFAYMSCLTNIAVVIYGTWCDPTVRLFESTVTRQYVVIDLERCVEVLIPISQVTSGSITGVSRRYFSVLRTSSCLVLLIDRICLNQVVFTI